MRRAAAPPEVHRPRLEAAPCAPTRRSFSRLTQTVDGVVPTLPPQVNFKSRLFRTPYRMRAATRWARRVLLLGAPRTPWGVTHMPLGVACRPFVGSAAVQIFELWTIFEPHCYPSPLQGAFLCMMSIVMPDDVICVCIFSKNQQSVPPPIVHSSNICTPPCPQPRASAVRAPCGPLGGCGYRRASSTPGSKSAAARSS